MSSIVFRCIGGGVILRTFNPFFESNPWKRGVRFSFAPILEQPSFFVSSGWYADEGFGGFISSNAINATRRPNSQYLFDPTDNKIYFGNAPKTVTSAISSNAVKVVFQTFQDFIDFNNGVFTFYYQNALNTRSLYNFLSPTFNGWNWRDTTSAGRPYGTFLTNWSALNPTWRKVA